jgi:hypothetical protein
VEIWDTEWGYASDDYFSKYLRSDGHSAAGRKRQAVLACREVLTVWALALPVAVWYDLRDDGEDPANPGQNYGLLDGENSDKPAMKALRTLTNIASNHVYLGMAENVPDGAHVMCLEGSSDEIFAIWGEDPASIITVRFPEKGFISATNLLGEPLQPKNDGHGEAEIALSEADGPVYTKFAPRWLRGVDSIQ